MTLAELDALRTCRKRIATASEAVERIRDELTRMSSALSDIPKGRSRGDKMATLVGRMVDIQAEQARIIVEREEMLIRAEDFMHRELRPQQQQFFELFYLKGLSLRDTAETAPYSIRQCKRINSSIRKRCHPFVIEMSPLDEV